MNELVNLSEFQTLLADYKLSKAALQTLSQTQLVLLVAPTSTGRNHLIRELLKTGDYYYIVSDTTRKPRTNDGVIDNAIKLKPDTLGIFILPPSFDEWQRRLHHRGEMHPEEYKRRMESAVSEFSSALERSYYKFVINDDVSSAVQQINTLAKLGEYDVGEQARGRHLAEQLLLETQILVRSL